MFLKSAFIISVLYSVVYGKQILDWCDPELCPNGGIHTACGNTGVSKILL